MKGLTAVIFVDEWDYEEVVIRGYDEEDHAEAEAVKNYLNMLIKSAPKKQSMAHKKYTVFKDQIEKLKGRVPDQAWAEETVRLLVEAGATREDLQEVSEQIKAMAILKAQHSRAN